MDGVLVDTEPHHLIIEKQLFTRLKLNVTEEEHRRYLGVSSFNMWREIAANHSINLSPEELAGINSDEITSYFSSIEKVPLMPGVKELLETIFNKGIPIALASSSDVRTIALLLSRTGLENYFRYKVSSETVGKSKPEPDIYFHTAGLLNVNPDECIVIEDSRNGIKAAKAAGMHCIAYNRFSVGTDCLSDADEIISDFSEIYQILQRFYLF